VVEENCSHHGSQEVERGGDRDREAERDRETEEIENKRKRPETKYIFEEHTPSDLLLLIRPHILKLSSPSSKVIG
jgi:hypothetical protein